MPFVEGAQYGIELFFPFDAELCVTKAGGRVKLDADWGAPDPETGIMWPPFRAFGEEYCTCRLLLDFEMPEDMAALRSRIPAM